MHFVALETGAEIAWSLYLPCFLRFKNIGIEGRGFCRAAGVFCATAYINLIYFLDTKSNIGINRHKLYNIWLCVKKIGTF